MEKKGQGGPYALFYAWCRAPWERASCRPTAAWRSCSLFPVLVLEKNVADHSLCCMEPRLSASLRSTDLAAKHIKSAKSCDHLALQSWFSPTTECERQTSTLCPIFLPSKTEWRPEKRIAQCMLCTAPQAHTASPHRKWGVWCLCCSFPTTSPLVVERVTMFWLSWSGKSSLGLSPALWASEPSLQCTREKPPPNLLVSWDMLGMAAVRYLLHLLSGCGDLGFLTLYIFFLYSKQNNF